MLLNRFCKLVKAKIAADYTMDFDGVFTNHGGNYMLRYGRIKLRADELLSNLEEVKSNASNGRLYLNSEDAGDEVIAVSINDKAKTFKLISKRNSSYVKSDLESRFQYAVDNQLDELDFVLDLLEIGYTLDDFRYSDDRYLWMKEFMEEHGLLDEEVS